MLDTLTLSGAPTACGAKVAQVAEACIAAMADAAHRAGCPWSGEVFLKSYI